MPEEQAGFKHFQLNDTPTVVGVSKEVDPGVGPCSRGDGQWPAQRYPRPLAEVSRACLWRQSHPEPGNPRRPEFSARRGTAFPPQYSTENSPSTMTEGQNGCKTPRPPSRADVRRAFGPEATRWHGEGQGSTGGEANSRFEEGLISAKIFGLLDGSRRSGWSPKWWAWWGRRLPPSPSSTACAYSIAGWRPDCTACLRIHGLAATGQRLQDALGSSR